MFGIDGPEFLLIIIVAVVVIGPKDMPMALRTVGRWIGKMRKVSNHFRAGLDAMVREAELEEMERKWREQNEAIMKASPQLPSMNPTAQDMAPPSGMPEDSPEGTPESNAPAPSSPVSPSPVSPSPVSQDGATGDAPEAEKTAARQAELQLPPPPP